MSTHNPYQSPPAVGPPADRILVRNYNYAGGELAMVLVIGPLLIAGMVWLWLRGGVNVITLRNWATPWGVAFGAGSMVGILVFLRVYLDVYRKHHAFAETELLNAMFVRDPSRWDSLSTFLQDVRGYESLGPFVVVLGLMILAWSAWRRVDKRVRLCLVWLALLSIVVLLIPLQLGVLQIGSELVGRAIGLPPGVGVTVSLVRTVRILAWSAVGLFLLVTRSEVRS